MFLPTVVHLLARSATVLVAAKPAAEEDDHAAYGSPEFWSKVLLSACLVLLGGVFAGLTLGLMGLDELHLRVLSMSSDNPIEKRNAQKVTKLLGKGKHWVLVVLLLGNVLVNESLPIFLDDAIGGGIWAIVISTTMIVIFGEIIPQALCARYGLAIGARCAPFVLVLMYLFSPIAYPIAKLLDHVLGASETNTYKKAELKSFLQFHRSGAEPLRDDEISILNGVLSLNEKKVSTIMTPIEDVATVSYDKILDHKAVDELLATGYSRFPVHESGKPTSFVGLLLVKKLLMYDPEDALPVSSFQLYILPEAKPTINCFQALDYFQTGRAHLLLISEHPGQPYGAIGVITLEDIIEEMINEEIVDETDLYVDNHTKKRAKRQSSSAIMRGIIERERRNLRSRTTSPDSASITRSILSNGKPTPGETARLVTIEEQPRDYGTTARDYARPGRDFFPRTDTNGTAGTRRTMSSERSQSRGRIGEGAEDVLH